MPNHITNQLKAIGDKKDIENLFESVKSENRDIDFEKIIPMPEHIYRGNLSKEEEEKYGKENCWYEWSLSNWGTKWNAYDICKVDENTIQFDTAWSGVPNIMVELSKLHPNVELHYKYADEDTGNNVGSHIIKNSNDYERDIINNSKEAYEIYIELKGESNCLYFDKEIDNYIHKDCDECEGC